MLFKTAEKVDELIDRTLIKPLRPPVEGQLVMKTAARHGILDESANKKESPADSSC